MAELAERGCKSAAIVLTERRHRRAETRAIENGENGKSEMDGARERKSFVQDFFEKNRVAEVEMEYKILVEDENLGLSNG